MFIYLFIFLFLDPLLRRRFTLLASCFFDYYSRYSYSAKAVFIGELHMKLNYLLHLLPECFALMHLDRSASQVRLQEAIRCVFRSAVIEWSTEIILSGAYIIF